MVNTPNCNKCNVLETYEHVFILCPAVEELWQHIQNYLNECKFTKDIRCLNTIVLGYKLTYSTFFYLNIILAVAGFSMHKAYFLSDSRLLNVNTYSIFKHEFNMLAHYFRSKHINDRFLNCMSIYLDNN